MRRYLFLPVLAFAAFAQQAAPPAFEVASVKVSNPAPQQTVQIAGGGFMTRGVSRGCRRPNPGSVNCTNATLKMLLVQAYGVKNYQIEGPSWLDSDGFDLMAKIPDGVPVTEVPTMLQALLADRFKVVLHKETKQLPAFELTVAKGGPKLKDVDPSEVAAFTAAQAQQAASGGNPPVPPPPLPPGAGGGRGGPMPMGSIMMSMSSTGARTVRGKMTMAQLTNMLSNQMSRPVLDKTELTGTYDIELTYLDETNSGMSFVGPPPSAGSPNPGGAAPPVEANTPIATLSQAVQQTLGLKLDAKKSPLEIIVVDSANKVPTEN